MKDKTRISNSSLLLLHLTIAATTLAPHDTAASRLSDAIGTDLAHDELVLEEDEAFGSLPVVLTASRLKQPLAEAPASVTIIDRKLLEATGARQLSEVFRLVPGMQVGRYNGNQESVSYHGIADENSKRLQVLINGRSVYQPGLSRILWSDLPLDLQYIDRIEVTRGPNSALYGANSYLAIINIITLTPGDVSGTFTSWTYGDKGVNEGLARFGKTLTDLEFSLTAGLQQDDGLDSEFMPGSELSDSRDLAYINIDSIYHLGEFDSIRINSAYKSGEIETKSVDNNALMPFHPIDVKNGFLHVTWNSQTRFDSEWKVHFYYNYSEHEEDWTACTQAIYLSEELSTLHDLDRHYTFDLIDAIANQVPLPLPPSTEAAQLTRYVLERLSFNGLSNVCGQVNQDMKEERFDLEIQNTIALNSVARIVSGFNFRKDIVESETFFGQQVDNIINRLFFNVEYKAQPDVIINLGAAYENDDIIGSEFSPRLALNYLFTPSQSLRFIVARANRSPDLFEEKALWSYTVSQPEYTAISSESYGRFYLTGVAQGNLQPEHITSYEMGYNNSSPQRGVEFDAKVYYDHLEDLIEDPLNINLRDFKITNNGEANIKGAELQLSYRPTSTFLAWASYAYIDVFNNTSQTSKLSAPTHSGSLTASYLFNQSNTISTSFTFMDEYYEENFSRFDIRYLKKFSLEHKYKLSLECVAQIRLDENNNYQSPNSFDSRTNYFVRASIDF